MRSTKRNRFLLFEHLESRRVLSTTYYIASTGSDASGDGSLAHPFATIQHGANLAKPGDTVDVQPGQYAGFVLGWDTPQGGTASAPITYKAEPGVTITSRNNKTADGIDLEPGDSYVNIIGFTVNNANTSITRAGIRVTGSDHVNVVGNNCTGNGTWGIFTAFSNYTLIQNNIASNSLSQHGIYVSNSADHPSVIGNTIFGNAQGGIQFNGDLSQGGVGIVTNALVANNVISNNGKLGGAAINGDGLCSSVIENNLLYNNHSTGIALFQQDGATGSTNNLVVNNTIVMASDSRWAINMNTGSTGNTLFNNVLFNENSSHGDILVDSSSLPGLRSDYNVLAGREDIGDGSTTISLSSWRSQSGQDAHSIQSTEAAVFVSPAAANYQLAASSPALNAGVGSFNGYLPPMTDMLGTARPAGGAFDIGAYETPSGAPVFTLSGAGTVTVGTSYSLTLTSTAATNDGMKSWLVNWGDGSTQTVTASAPTQVNGQWVTTTTVTHTFAAAGNDSISATATDANGTFNANNALALQVNPVAAPPTLTLSGASSVDAGANYVLTLTSSSNINDAVQTWFVSWGDGSTQTVVAGPEALVNGQWVTTITATHLYSAAGVASISATATDLSGTFDAGNTLALQINTPPPPPPVADPLLTLTGATSCTVKNSYVLTLTCTDAVNDNLSKWIIRWGDGSKQSVAATAETCVNGLWVTTLTVKHTYSSTGTYTISAQGVDPDGTYAASNTLRVKITRR